MYKLIKTLQNKPEPVKRLIMWFGIFAIMVAIFMFWLLTFPSQTQNVAESDAATNLKKELPTALNSLKSQASELFKLIK